MKRRKQMIEILSHSTENCLAIHFSGKVTGEEYQTFLDALEAKFQGTEKVNLVMELSGFDFHGDFEAVKKDFKFGFGGYKKIHRAAFVGDQKWIEWFTRLIGPFTRTEEKYFREGQFEEAYAWACS
jgi:hypothetical protein